MTRRTTRRHSNRRHRRTYKRKSAQRRRQRTMSGGEYVPVYPNTGPPIIPDTILNDASPQRGGCGCGMPSFFRGGGESEGMMTPERPVNTPTITTPEKPERVSTSPSITNIEVENMTGGSHRIGCQCSACKQKGGMVGVSSTSGALPNPMPYPINSYENDLSRQMVDLGANPPYLKGGRRRTHRNRLSRRHRRRLRQKGGNLTNFLAQDLVNVGRQIQFGMGSAYNALAGYSAPVNPLPWRDQFPTRASFNPSTI